ncbi:MAG: (d)CMP kinase [Nanoarchaeota archaeon]
MKITIGGVPGAGKSTVAKLVADKLGYDFYSIGAIRRKLAEEKGLTIHEFNSLPEDTDSMVDEYQRQLGKEGDNFVNEGRLAFHFVPDSVKIYFMCHEQVAAQRIMTDSRSSEGTYSSIDDAVEGVRKRMQSDRERYAKHYNIDCYEPKHFSHVIDTTNLTIDRAVEEVLKIANSYNK